MSIDVAYLNRNAISWGHLLFRITLPDVGNAGGRLFGFHSLDFGGQKRDRQHIYGQNEAQAPMAVSNGKYVPPFPKLGFWAHSLDASETAPFDSLISLLKKGAVDGRSYGEVRMNWLLQVDAKGLEASYEWLDVYMTEDGGQWTNEDEGLKREATFICTRFYTNGGTLFNSTYE